MYNVEKLEGEWKLYRRKRRIRPVALFLFILSMGFAVLYYMQQNGIKMDQNNTKQIVATDDIPTGKEDRRESNTIGKISNLKTEVPSLREKKVERRPKVGQIIFQEEGKILSQKPNKRKNLVIQVTERGGKDIANDIENRFEYSKNASDSLFLAKYYYDKMNYNKAEKWALETNRLDSSIEESWLIFAKSQVKQGKRIEALKVLKVYLDKSGSRKAKVLMDKIRRGKNF